MDCKPKGCMTDVPGRLASGVVGVALLLGCGLRADIVVDPSSPTVTPSGGYYEWSYNVQVLRGQFVDPSIPTGLNRPFDGFVVYDVQGYVPGSAAIKDPVTGE